MAWPARTITAAALACCGGFALIGWMMWPTPTPPVAPSTPLPIAPQAATIPQIPTTPKVVYVYRDRPVPLPAAKPTEHVTATARLDAEERPYTLSATLDAESGKSRIWSQPEALPWLGLSRHGAAGLAYGYRAGQPIFRLSIRQDVLRSKQIFGGVAASLDSDGQWFAGIGAEYRW